MTRGEAIESLKRDIHNAKISGHQTSQYEMAIKALEGELYYKDLANSYEKTINKLTKAISEQEQKKGHWIFWHREDLGERLNHMCECSECGKWFSTCDLLYKDYCPSCGAKMDFNVVGHTKKWSIKEVANSLEKHGLLKREPETEWILVKNNMPVVGEEVLVCDLDGDIYITYLHTDGRWGFDYDGNKIKNVIAWQPLPKPYKESEE